jgi:hypothetical protein
METSDTQTFELPGSAVTKAYWQLAGAVALILFSLANFFVALRVNVTMINLQLTCTVPMLLAVFLIATAIRTLRMAVFVQITPEALQIRRRSGAMLVLPWQRIVVVNTGSPPLTSKKHLTLYDAGGKVLARLAEDFQNFQDMELAIRARQVQSPQQSHVKRGQNRRKGVFFMVFGVVFTALGAANAWIALKEHSDNDLFQKLGRPTNAAVVRQFIAPDGRTHRIEFRVDDVPNAPVVNVEANQFLWAAMKPGQHIPVVAVPGRPDIAHLAIGEVRNNLTPPFGMMMLLSVVISVFAIAVFVVGVLVFRGMQAKWI